jgi:hypothetical protein
MVDLGALPGLYLPATWSVDRLHPSELGHRMLAIALAETFAAAGVVVPTPVSRECAGSRPISRVDRTAWLVCKGIPWLWRRGRDLVPYALGVLLRAAVSPKPKPKPVQTDEILARRREVGQRTS